jgi:hypothetical protein
MMSVSLEVSSENIFMPSDRDSDDFHAAGGVGKSSLTGTAAAVNLIPSLFLTEATSHPQSVTFITTLKTHMTQP